MGVMGVRAVVIRMKICHPTGVVLLISMANNISQAVINNSSQTYQFWIFIIAATVASTVDNGGECLTMADRDSCYNQSLLVTVIVNVVALLACWLWIVKLCQPRMDPSSSANSVFFATPIPTKKLKMFCVSCGDIVCSWDDPM